jgi:hypothetical protein
MFQSPSNLLQIRGAEKAAREVYSYTLTELQRLRNKVDGADLMDS